MSRPVVSSVTTRERILLAAAGHLSLHGYAQTHLADIAEVAGLKPPAIYYYFPSRDDLVTAVLEEGQRLARRHVVAALRRLGPGSGARARIMAAVEAHLRVELELSDFARAVTRNAGHVPPAIRQALKAESGRYHDVWRHLVDEAVGEGVLRPDLEPTVARLLVIGALNWTAEWRRGHHSVDNIVLTAQQLIARALFIPADRPHRHRIKDQNRNTPGGEPCPTPTSSTPPAPR